MNTKFLFPNKFKMLGWIMFLPASLLGLALAIFQFEWPFLDVKVFAILADELLGESQHFSIIENNILDEIIGVFVILGAIFIAFSKEKYEDEYIAKIRFESLVWATYVNYAILLFALIFIYEFDFFWVMVYNMFTILIFFIIRFYWLLHRSKKMEVL